VDPVNHANPVKDCGQPFTELQNLQDLQKLKGGLLITTSRRTALF
jgi:hypothetical protein